MKFKVHYASPNSVNEETMVAIIHGRETMIRLVAENILREERDKDVGVSKHTKLIIREANTDKQKALLK